LILKKWENFIREVKMKTVRRAEEKDIPKILELLVQVDMVHHKGRPDLFKGPATKYNAEELKEILQDEKTPVFVCVDGADIPMGHAFCIQQHNPNDHVLTDVKTLYIDDICVDEQQRGKNVGKTLYEYLVGYAKENGYYNITLNVWTCNPGAMKFYEAMGLVPQKIGMEKIIEE
jgi:ribosomal protein S18 acetylase RimI-like enzyme